MRFVLRSMFQSLRAKFASPVVLRLQFQEGHLSIRQGGNLSLVLLLLGRLRVRLHLRLSETLNLLPEPMRIV